MTDTPERELIEALRSPTQWSCIFEYDGQPRYGTTDAPIRAADTIEALLSRVDKLEEALRECPIGLFWSGEELCLKTEYGNNEGRIDAYIVSTGEFFWGSPPQSIASQREELVEPIDTDDAAAALTQLDELRAALRRFMEEGGCFICGGDCGGANPPIVSCPMQQARKALGGTNAPE